jgi:GNAT superfamily N-acetyltransferase
MPTPVIRMADPADGAALAALRQEWTEEDTGNVVDEGFVARFLEWYERESARRLTWLAEIEHKPVGMMNLSVFERMPRPGVDVGRWGYVGNAFVLAEHRDQGIGSLLLAALLAYADSHGFVRVVLRPSERAIPFYRRAGFGANGGLLVRPRRLAGRADPLPGSGIRPRPGLPLILLSIACGAAPLVVVVAGFGIVRLRH